VCSRVQLESDQSVSCGSDGSRIRSDSGADELATDDCASYSSGVFRENGDAQPVGADFASETNNNTIRHVSG